MASSGPTALFAFHLGGTFANVGVEGARAEMRFSYGGDPCLNVGATYAFPGARRCPPGPDSARPCRSRFPDRPAHLARRGAAMDLQLSGQARLCARARSRARDVS